METETSFFDQQIDLDTFREQFETEWGTSHAPSIEDTLKRVPVQYQTALLEELLYVDIEFRTKKLEIFSDDDYFERFPKHHDLIRKILNNVNEYSPFRKCEIGGCVLLQELGRGGMGIVYLADHRFLGCKVAVKKIHEQYSQNKEAVSRFLREILAMGKLLEQKHPNIVEIRHAQLDDDLAPYLVMEYVPGMSVDKFAESFFASGVIALGSPEHLRVMTEIVLGAAEGLSCIHNVGLIHRDIKPSNLMRQPNSVIKILDLGLAKLHDSIPVPVDEPQHPTLAGLGTLIYMSPEQMCNSSEIDIRSDIYSLGQTFYWLLHAKHPGEPKSPETPLPSELKAILNKMIERNPNDRYQDPKSLIVELQNFLRKIKKIPLQRHFTFFNSRRFFASSLLATSLLTLLTTSYFIRRQPDRLPKQSPHEISTENEQEDTKISPEIDAAINNAIEDRFSGDSELAEERLLQIENELKEKQGSTFALAKVQAALADCTFFHHLAAGHLSEKTILQLNKRYSMSQQSNAAVSWRFEALFKQSVMEIILYGNESKAVIEMERLKNVMAEAEESLKTSLVIPYRFAEAMCHVPSDLQQLRNFVEQFQLDSGSFSSDRNSLDYRLFAIEYLIDHDRQTNKEKLNDDLGLLDMILMQSNNNPQAVRFLNRYFDMAIRFWDKNDLKHLAWYILRSRPVFSTSRSATHPLLAEDSTYILFYFSPNESNGFAIYYPKERENAKRFEIPYSRLQIKDAVTSLKEKPLQLDRELVTLIRKERSQGRLVVLSWDDTMCWARRRDALSNDMWPFDASIKIEEIIGQMK